MKTIQGYKAWLDVYGPYEWTEFHDEDGLIGWRRNVARADGSFRKFWVLRVVVAPYEALPFRWSVTEYTWREDERRYGGLTLTLHNESTPQEARDRAEQYFKEHVAS